MRILLQHRPIYKINDEDYQVFFCLQKPKSFHVARDRIDITSKDPVFGVLSIIKLKRGFFTNSYGVRYLYTVHLFIYECSEHIPMLLIASNWGKCSRWSAWV